MPGHKAAVKVDELIKSQDTSTSKSTGQKIGPQLQDSLSDTLSSKPKYGRLDLETLDKSPLRQTVSVLTPLESDRMDMQRELQTIVQDPRLQRRFEAVDEQRKLSERLKKAAKSARTYANMTPLLNIGLSARDTRSETQRTRMMKNLRDTHNDPFVRLVANMLAREHWMARNTGIAKTAVATISTGLSAFGGLGAGLTLATGSAMSASGPLVQSMTTSAVDGALKSGTGQATIESVSRFTKQGMGPKPHPLMPRHTEEQVNSVIGTTTAQLSDPEKMRAVIEYLGEGTYQPEQLADQDASFDHEVARLKLKTRMGCGSNVDLTKRVPYVKDRRGFGTRFTKKLGKTEYLDEDELKVWRQLKNTKRTKDIDGDTITGLPPVYEDQTNTLALLWKSEDLFGKQSSKQNK